LLSVIYTAESADIVDDAKSSDIVLLVLLGLGDKLPEGNQEDGQADQRDNVEFIGGDAGSVHFVGKKK